MNYLHSPSRGLEFHTGSPTTLTSESLSLQPFGDQYQALANESPPPNFDDLRTPLHLHKRELTKRRSQEHTTYSNVGAALSPLRNEQKHDLLAHWATDNQENEQPTGSRRSQRQQQDLFPLASNTELDGIAIDDEPYVATRPSAPLEDPRDVPEPEVAPAVAEWPLRSLRSPLQTRRSPMQRDELNALNELDNLDDLDKDAPYTKISPFDIETPAPPPPRKPLEWIQNAVSPVHMKATTPPSAKSSFSKPLASSPIRRHRPSTPVAVPERHPSSVSPSSPPLHRSASYTSPMRQQAQNDDFVPPSTMSPLHRSLSTSSRRAFLVDDEEKDELDVQPTKSSPVTYRSPVYSNSSYSPADKKGIAPGNATSSSTTAIITSASPIHAIAATSLSSTTTHSPKNNVSPSPPPPPPPPPAVMVRAPAAPAPRVPRRQLDNVSSSQSTSSSIRATRNEDSQESRHSAASTSIPRVARRPPTASHSRTQPRTSTGSHGSASSATTTGSRSRPMATPVYRLPHARQPSPVMSSSLHTTRTGVPHYMQFTESYMHHLHSAKEEAAAKSRSRASSISSRPSNLPHIRSTTKINASDEILSQMSPGEEYIPLAARVKLFEKELSERPSSTYHMVPTKCKSPTLLTSMRSMSASHRHHHDNAVRPPRMKRSAAEAMAAPASKRSRPLERSQPSTLHNQPLSSRAARIQQQFHSNLSNWQAKDRETRR
ncbi:hypothetical protein BC940DRAFT_306907 [Gongronella butleri]|nr:hypothetical protein BC940DRAFT_306907 [Gongronella butleri]